MLNQKQFLPLNAGLVLLEYAIVAVVGLPLLLLLLDVGNIFRVKTSLQESVKRTLRCLTPLEADCILTSGKDPLPLYDVEIKRATTRWPVPEYVYSVTAESLFGTTHLFRNPIATVLDKVSYTTRDLEYQITQKKERLKFNLDYYLKTASLPYVDTGKTSASSLSPKFIYRHSQNVVYPRETLDLSHVIGTVRDLTQAGTAFYKLIGTKNFTVPSAVSLPCFNSEALDYVGRSHEANFNLKCHPQVVPTVLFITGQFPVDSLAQGSRGRIWINLKGKGLSINGQNASFKKFNLGARAFSYDSNNFLEANFVPRGAPLANVSAVNNFPEFSLYQNILLQPGETYTLEFYLQRTNEVAIRTGWQGQKLRLFYGQYQRVQEEHYCQEANLYHDNGVARCRFLQVAGKQIPENLLTDSNIEYQQEVLSTGCGNPEEIKQQVCSNCNLEIKENSTCSEKRITKPCPINYGVAFNPNTTSLFEAQKICPISDLYQDSSTEAVYTEKKINLPSAELNLEQLTCDDIPSPKESDYASMIGNYKKISWQSHQARVGRQIDSQGISPSKFKAGSPAYNCGAFAIKKIKHDYHATPENHLPEGVKTSLLFGAHSELVTGCNWQEVVKEEAQKILSFSALDYLEIQRALLQYSYLDEQPVLSCYNYLPQKQVDLGGAEVPNQFGPVTLNEIPSICEEKDVTCEIKLVGFQNTEKEQIEWDRPLAISKGYEALRATYAGAKQNCNPEKPNCFNMNISFDGKTFDVYASMELPLLSLLGKKQIKVNYRSQGIHQGALLGQVEESQNKF